MIKAASQGQPLFFENTVVLPLFEALYLANPALKGQFDSQNFGHDLEYS